MSTIFVDSSKRVSIFLFIFKTIITKSKKVVSENKVETLIKNFTKHKLLIIDELGCLPVDKMFAFVFFQLIDARYEKRSTIITSNQPLSKWSEVFVDPVLVNAILDILLHHYNIINIVGKSYRTKILFLNWSVISNKSLLVIEVASKFVTFILTRTYSQTAIKENAKNLEFESNLR